MHDVIQKQWYWTQSWHQLFIQFFLLFLIQGWWHGCKNIQGETNTNISWHPLHYPVCRLCVYIATSKVHKDQFRKWFDKACIEFFLFSQRRCDEKIMNANLLKISRILFDFASGYMRWVHILMRDESVEWWNKKINRKEIWKRENQQ